MRDIEIYFNRRKKLLIDKTEVIENYNLENNNVYIATILKNLQDYGFTLSVSLIDELRKLNPNYLVKWYRELEEVIKNELGVRDNQEPMYKNFPKEVMELDTVEYFINAILHYVSFGEILPESEKEERVPLIIEKDSLEIIDLGNEEDFYSIFKNLLESKSSLSVTDRKDIDWAINNIEFKNIVPETIYVKEILIALSQSLLKYNKIEEFELIKSEYKTCTDVLRLAVALSDGDISLSVNPYFKNFSVKERRLILSLLDNCKNMNEDMYRYKEYWKRLGEKIHPNKYQEYQNAIKGFAFIRSNQKITSFKGKVEREFKNNNLSSLLELLSSRPGEFARSLDRVLRIFNSEKEQKETLNTFKDIAFEIPTPLLLQVKAHFNKRQRDSKYRVFCPKGDVSKCYNIENTLEDINEKVCLNVCGICNLALMKNYSEKEKLGKVYLDLGLLDYKVPTSQRSASKTLRTVARGSRIKLDLKSNILRAFIYWKNTNNENSLNNRVDIDLSIATYTEDLQHISSFGYFSYPNEHTNKLYVFSGDITNAPNGAAEYIDLNIANLINEGVRYVVVSVNSFTEQQFKNLPDCFAGIMERENMYDGEAFEPSTVTNKLDLSNGTKASIPLVIDLKSREMIWADMGLTTNNNYLNNIVNNKYVVKNILQSLLDIEKCNLYELFMLHAISRGTIVDNIEEADTIFTVDKYDYPYEEILEKLNKEKEELEQKLIKTDIVDIDFNEIENLKSINLKIEEIKSKEVVNVTAYDIDIIVSQFI